MMDGKRRVLVVEDDADLATVVQLVLERDGYETVVASDGIDALEKLDGARPGLVLLDMRMPRMNGERFAAELRHRYGDAIPIVVVTAAEHARARAESIAAADVLPKPFDVDALLAVVARHVR